MLFFRDQEKTINSFLSIDKKQNPKVKFNNKSLF